MKFIFIFIFSLLLIDSITAYPCGIKCKEGQKLKCPEKKGRYQLLMGLCQLLSRCKCVNEKVDNKLKIKDKINNISSNK